MKNLKKKFALLLAFVMVLSMVPTNVFARTLLRTNENQTAVVQDGLFNLDIDPNDLVGQFTGGVGLVLDMFIEGDDLGHAYGAGGVGVGDHRRRANIWTTAAGETAGHLRVPNVNAQTANTIMPVQNLGNGWFAQIQVTGNRTAQAILKLANVSSPMRVANNQALLPGTTIFSGSVLAEGTVISGLSVASGPAITGANWVTGGSIVVSGGNATLNSDWTVPEAGQGQPSISITPATGSVVDVDVASVYPESMDAIIGIQVPPNPPAMNQLILPRVDIDTNAATLRVQVRGAVGNLLPATQFLHLPTDVAQQGVIFNIDPITFGDWGVAALADLHITERQRGTFANSGFTGEGNVFVGNWILLELLAPFGYTWVNRNVEVLSNGTRTGGAVGGTIAITGDHREANFFEGRERLTLWINTGVYETGPVGEANPGRITLRGLQLQPGTGALPEATDLTVRARLLPQGNDNATRYANWRGNLNIGSRAITGLAMTLSPSLSDVDVLDAGLASGWDTTGIIRISTTAPGSFINNPTIVLETVSPGVQIRGVRWRTYDAGETNLPSWNAQTIPILLDQVRTENLHLTETSVRIDTDAHSTTRNRVVDIQLDVRVDPGFEDDVVDVNVTVHGHRDLTNQIISIANVRDPFILSANEVTTINPVGDVFGFIHPTPLGDVTFEEAAVGRLVAGRFLYVAVVPTFGGGNFFPLTALMDVGFTTSLTPTITGPGDLLLGRGQRVPFNQVPDEFPDVPVYRFRVDRATSAARGSNTITFTNNMLSGTGIWNVPGMEFSFIVGGNAVANAVVGPVGIDPVQTNNQSRFHVAPMPYSVTIANVPGELGEATPPAPGQPGDDNEGPGVGPGPGPGPDLQPLAPAFSISPTQRDVGNELILIPHGGRTFVSLRGLGEIIDPVFGLVNWNSETRVATFVIDNAHGVEVSVTLSPNPAYHRVTSGGQTLPAANFGFVNLDGRWAVDVVTVASLYGFRFQPNGAGFSFYYPR